MHDFSYNLMKDFILSLPTSEPLSLLDVGSLRVGNQRSYKDIIIKHTNFEYVGLDVIKGNNVDIVADYPYSYPIKDNSFDIVISGQTLEHVQHPYIFVRNLNNILKPKGRICLIAPSAGYEHHNPDYWRILPDGMKSLLESNDFRYINVKIYKNKTWNDCVGIATK